MIIQWLDYHQVVKLSRSAQSDQLPFFGAALAMNYDDEASNLEDPKVKSVRPRGVTRHRIVSIREGRTFLIKPDR